MSYNGSTWSPRDCRTSVWFQERIWVLGGGTVEGGPTNGVWYTATGGTQLQAATTRFPSTPRLRMLTPRLRLRLHASQSTGWLPHCTHSGLRDKPTAWLCTARRPVLRHHPVLAWRRGCVV